MKMYGIRCGRKDTVPSQARNCSEIPNRISNHALILEIIIDLLFVSKSNGVQA